MGRLWVLVSSLLPLACSSETGHECNDPALLANDSTTAPEIVACRCPVATVSELPSSFSLLVSPRSPRPLTFSCQGGGTAGLQTSAAFRAPEDGDYTFTVESYDGVTVALYEEGCCGPELACAAGEEVVSLTHTLTAGQLVAIGGATDIDSADVKDIVFKVDRAAPEPADR